jgi:hypothetical protein
MEITIRILKKQQIQEEKNYRKEKAQHKKKNKQAKDKNKEQGMREDGNGNIEVEKRLPKDNTDTGNNKEEDENHPPTGNPTGAANKLEEPEQNYTKEKPFHCIMPCTKGKGANFTFPKEYSVMATVMIMGLIPYTKNMYGDEAKKWFGWSVLGREDGAQWCKSTPSIIPPNDKMIHAGLTSNLWWLGDNLATGVEDQTDTLAMSSCPKHNLGQNESITNERQITTGSLVTFAEQMDARVFDASSAAGGSMTATTTTVALTRSKQPRG